MAISSKQKHASGPTDKEKMDRRRDSKSSMKQEQRFGPYLVGETVGRGSFGKVKMAVHETTGTKVALKVISLKLVEASAFSRLKLQREIRVLKLLHHPHIMRLYDVVRIKNDIVLVLELVSGGELFEYLFRRGKLSEDVARIFFQQLISAIAHCEERGVAHRDLKLENIFLESNMKGLKIGDFGLSSLSHDGRMFETSCGTPNYAAPEVVSGRMFVGREADIWSCGVVLYTVLAGVLPFDDDHLSNLFKKIQTAEYSMPSFFSPEAKDLIKRILVVNPLMRATSTQILNHPWVRKNFPDYLAVLHQRSIEAAHIYPCRYVVNVDTISRQQEDGKCGFPMGDLVVGRVAHKEYNIIHEELNLDVVKSIAARFKISADDVTEVLNQGQEGTEEVSEAQKKGILLCSTRYTEIDMELAKAVQVSIPLADEILRNRAHDMQIAYAILLHRKQNEILGEFKGNSSFHTTSCNSSNALRSFDASNPICYHHTTVYSDGTSEGLIKSTQTRSLLTNENSSNANYSIFSTKSTTPLGEQSEPRSISLGSYKGSVLRGSCGFPVEEDLVPDRVNPEYGALTEFISAEVSASPQSTTGTALRPAFSLQADDTQWSARNLQGNRGTLLRSARKAAAFSLDCNATPRMTTGSATPETLASSKIGSQMGKNVSEAGFCSQIGEDTPAHAVDSEEYYFSAYNATVLPRFPNSKCGLVLSLFRSEAKKKKFDLNDLTTVDSHSSFQTLASSKLTATITSTNVKKAPVPFPDESKGALESEMKSPVKSKGNKKDPKPMPDPCDAIPGERLSPLSSSSRRPMRSLRAKLTTGGYSPLPSLNSPCERNAGEACLTPTHMFKIGEGGGLVSPRERGNAAVTPVSQSRLLSASTATGSLVGSNVMPSGLSSIFGIFQVGVLFRHMTTEDIMRLVYHVLQKYGFVWMTMRPFKLAAVTSVMGNTPTKVFLLVFRAGDRKQDFIIDVRLSKLCAGSFESFDVCAQLISSLCMLARETHLRRLILSKHIKTIK